MTELETKKDAYRAATARYTEALSAYSAARDAFTAASQRQQRLETDQRFDRFPSLVAERDALAELAGLQRRIPVLHSRMDAALLQTDDALNKVHGALSEWQDACTAYNTAALAQQRGEVEVAVGPLMAALMELDARSLAEIMDSIMAGFTPKKPVPVAVAIEVHLADADFIRANGQRVRWERSRQGSLPTAPPVDPLHAEIAGLRRAVGH